MLLSPLNKQGNLQLEHVTSPKSHNYQGTKLNLNPCLQFQTQSTFFGCQEESFTKQKLLPFILVGVLQRNEKQRKREKKEILRNWLTQWWVQEI